MLDGASPLLDRLQATLEHAFNGGIPIRRKDGKGFFDVVTPTDQGAAR